MGIEEKEGKAVEVTVFLVGGFSRHFNERGVRPFKRAAAKELT